MVTLSQVRQSNAQLIEANAPRTALFVGGTSGIGKYTLTELVSLNLPIRIYIVGRKATEPVLRPLLEDLRARNPEADLIWVEGEVSLLSEVRRICALVESKEPRLDLLCLTAGYPPFGGRNNTSEGLEVTYVLEYYGRMLFTLRLLPLLRASPCPRVLTVLGGSMLSPKRFIADDINLEKEGNFGGFQSQTQMTTMTTLFLDRLSSSSSSHDLDDENKNKNNNDNNNDNNSGRVVFVHNWPGAVDTGNAMRYHTPSIFSPLPLTSLLKPLLWALGSGEKEAGARHVYLATSGNFGGVGPKTGGGAGEAARGTQGEEGRGLFLVNHKCEVVDRGEALEELREMAQERVWEGTMKILRPYL